VNGESMQQYSDTVQLNSESQKLKIVREFRCLR